jgi:hypothetical protein
MKKDIEIKYYEERDGEETASHLNKLFQQYSISLQNRIRVNNEIESFISLKFSINEIGKVTECALIQNSRMIVPSTVTLLKCLRDTDFHQYRIQKTYLKLNAHLFLHQIQISYIKDINAYYYIHELYQNVQPFRIGRESKINRVHVEMYSGISLHVHSLFCGGGCVATTQAPSPDANSNNYRDQIHIILKMKKIATHKKI